MADFQFETNSFVWKFNQLTSLGVNANLTFKRVDGKLLVNLEAAKSKLSSTAQNLESNYSPPKVKIVRKLGMT